MVKKTDVQIFLDSLIEKYGGRVIISYLNPEEDCRIMSVHEAVLSKSELYLLKKISEKEGRRIVFNSTIYWVKELILEKENYLIVGGFEQIIRDKKGAIGNLVLVKIEAQD
jgi:hypothetical protein